MSLALSTVIYEWRRYMAAVVALAASGVMVLALVGLFVGIVDSATATITRSPADLLVLPAKSNSLFGSNGMPRRLMPLVYMNPEVVSVSDEDDGGGMFTNLGQGKEKKRTFVQIMAVDTAKGALSLPTDIDDNTRLALSEPYAAVIDSSVLAQLGVHVGSHAAIDGHEVVIAGLVHGYASTNGPMVMVSRATLRLLHQARPSNRIGPMLVKIRDPSRALQVRDQLNAAGKDQFRAWTKADLSLATDNELMSQQIIGVILGFAMFIGGVVGIVITWQTLRGAILSNIKEFASLRALGVGMGSLSLVVMEISFWVGVLGLIVTFALIGLLGWACNSIGIPMGFPLGFIITTAILLLIIAVMSGFFSVGVLKKSQPADLLR